jgi:hypothetical protein
MDISVVLEQLNDDAYRATVFAPTPLVAEASTRQQAIERIRQMLLDKLSRVEVIHVEVPETEGQRDPWNAVIGTWTGHPDANTLEQNLQDCRQDVDADVCRL